MKISQVDLDILNTQLKSQFGLFEDGRPNWRVVWSDDQFEKRLTGYTPEGLLLLTQEVREFPKYTHIQHKYVLERLTAVPDFQRVELAGAKTSYEPIWTFEDVGGNALPPKYEFCKFLIDSLLDKTNAPVPYAKYKDDPEAAKKELDATYEQLFGNETDVTDALAYKQGVVVPFKQFGEK